MDTQARGALTSTTPFVFDMGRIAFPCTIELNSANAARKIELSTNGVTYFTPAVDSQETSQLLLAVDRRVSFMRVTGAAADTWSIV